MTDESTLPMAGPRGPAGIACLLEPEQSDGCEGGDDGRVNNPERLPADMEVDATRGTGTPRSEAQGYRPSGEVDELQIVIGGWNECRRDHIEQDVQDIFGRMNGNALVKQVFIPYVRCGYCRVEINYPEQDIWKMRKLQGVIVQAIKELGFTSTSPGQERCKFWATRNRSIQDRAKVRAVISTWELCVRHVGDASADKDWRGKVWVNSVQVLHHVDTRSRPEDTLMLLDSRGTETGWFLDIAQMQACLGISRDAILSHYGLG
ncbi:hypothetical protein AK812_SmicGene30689 [Symbiodinium microadriaticum]|uniref:Uncharacterized protein n=1 Tax=Symbiodinium microadriaticum TaxID=2951 RepID=A0A1Q9CYL4_SYMMI|nr:hypothetical protein AK812_SmicGene30689 [Symbiodinium microadriaticum]